MASAPLSAATLERIHDRQTIVFAYRDGAAPFSFKDRDGRVRGYSAELCTRIAAAIERQLQLPGLKVEWIAVDADTRIEAVASGRADAECGTTTITLSRMPHADTAIVREAKRLGLVCLPGVATPTEAFAALAAGADGLKMFPAEATAPAALRAWRAVLPRSALVFAVGGIRPDNMAPWWAEGAAGFGTGSNLYKPCAPVAQIRAGAAAYAAAFRALRR